MKNYKFQFIQIMNQLGQSFFLPNKHLGLLILLCTAISNFWAPVFGVICICACRYIIDKLKANQLLSLVGFVDVNAYFLGVGLSFFFESSLSLLFLSLVMAACLAYVIVFFQRVLAPWQLPMLVVPLLMCLGLVWLLREHALVLNVKKNLTSLDPIFKNSYSLVVLGSLRSFSQVFFSSSALVGGVFLFGIFFISRKHFMLLLTSSLYANGLVYMLGLDVYWIASGLLGFNAILVAAAYLALEESFSTLSFLVLISFSCILAVVSSIFFFKLGLLSLSFPYVLVVWIYLLTKSKSSLAERTGLGAKKWILS